MINLDSICAEYGLKISKVNDSKVVKEYKNIVEKALGVLQAQGIYSLFLFLESEGKNDIKDKLVELLSSDKLNLLSNDKDKQDIKDKISSEILQDLDKLMLAYNILERCLIYTKYNLKAKSK
ncbi:MAG: hypothetical protein KatS3mg003_1495 [Candidatus Nitrosocaldaceae archaeon]|nr:MAG: hypothetical protein KatS3mg003_1495 [Candidatus Nitrosocaldaceae archaeon]